LSGNDYRTTCFVWKLAVTDVIYRYCSDGNHCRLKGYHKAKRLNDEDKLVTFLRCICICTRTFRLLFIAPIL